VFSLDTFSDKTFTRMTAVSVLTLVLATVFGPLQSFLKTTFLDVQQWIICSAVALSIIVVSEIQKAARRRVTTRAIPAGGEASD
jgi:P-type Ca2+ transporter type 2C